MRHSIPRPALMLASAVFTGSLGPTTAYPRVARIAVTRPVPFQVETGSSRIYIKVGATGRFGHAHGVHGRLVSGKVDLGGSGELVFDMRSFVVDPPEARQYVGLGGGVSRSDQRKTTEDMLGPFVLDVVHHPRATYTIASATPLEGQAPGDPGRYQLDGQLTLRGVARRLPIAAIVERTETPGLFRLLGAFSILQTRFGITPYTALGGIVGVADQLDIWGELVIRTPTR